MNIKKLEKPSNLFNYCHTNCDAISTDFHWKIHNFSLSSHKRIESTVFSTSSDSDIKWKLILYREFIEKFEKFASISLHMTKYKDEKINAAITVSIIKNDGSEYSKSFIKYFKSKCEIWDFSKFIEYDALFDGYLKNDTLHIKCKIKWCNEDVNYHSQDLSDLHKDTKNLDRYLSKEISSLYEDERFSDVFLEVDDVTFRVHKVILAARSSVFAAMFEHEMKEKKEDVVKIKEMEPEIVKEMLRFIYTGRVEGLEEKAIELLMAADMYDLSGLKLMCEKTICKYFTVDNIGYILHVASIHSAENLKRMAVDFIKEKM